jgi:hypothetical protein
VRHPVRCRLGKANDGLAGLGKSQLFARQPFNGFGVVPQSIDGSFQLAALFRFLVNLSVEPEDFFSHPLIVFDKRQVPNSDNQKARYEEEKDHQSSQLFPDAKIDFHTDKLTMRGEATKVIF